MPEPRFTEKALWRALRDALGRFLHHAPTEKDKEINMSTITQTLEELMKQEGALCVALVDSSSGMMLGHAGGGINMEVAAAANTEVVRAKLKAMRALGMNDKIEDILITLGKQYHILHPLSNKEDVFLYGVFDRQHANLALARLKAKEVEKDLTF